MTEFTLMVAPNGARRGKGDHLALPLTAEELAATAKACHQLGAQALHMHVRDDEGVHSLDAGRYRDAIAAVTECAPAMHIQITTESAGLFDVPAQLACLEALRPAAASVSVREMARDAALAARAYAVCAEAGTQVQHILYTPACVAQLQAWYADGTVPQEMRDVILVLGQYATGQPAAPAMLPEFLALIAPLALRWSLCAFGPQEHACLLAAVKAGGQVRIGFENSLGPEDGAPWADNAASVAVFLQQATARGHILAPQTDVPGANLREPT
ncbi:BKACE family enzyme [Tritonibacter mobilis]|uniref:3-keto-5-aminohexanoate cleavage protein n=1 Tax=Tritonibacter mobilis TaxID=379347 RepID=UPI000806E2F9|nr:3-keto-5-aminohexanoate cleavage protein [Tritonibacter mobilis]